MLFERLKPAEQPSNMTHIIGQKKKVFFISSLTGGAYFYRCYLPIKYLNKYSKKYEATGDVDIVTRERNKKPKEFQEADMVVFHRPNKPTFFKLGSMMKMRGRKVVMDNDDTFKLDFDHTIAKMWRGAIKEDISEQEKHKKICKTYNDILYGFMGFSDMVTTSTEAFKVKVMPNYLDVESWPEPKKNETDTIRIGFSGSTNKIRDAKVIKNVLDEVMKRDDVRLVIQGFQSNEILKRNPRLKEYMEPHIFYWQEYGDKVEFVDYVFPLEYPYTLNDMRMDMMLIPRMDNEFNRAKSNIKYLEASILKIPVVATGFLDDRSPYQKDIKDGENGFIAMNEEDWRTKINALIKSKKLREEIGNNAYKYVKANYDWKDHWQEYEQNLDNIYSNLR